MNRTLSTLASGAAGFVFGMGLIVSGMFNPAKVLAFLDLAGRWDPSLALVMIGAVAIASAGFAIARRRTQTLLGGPMQITGARRIDPPLVLGSLTFGVGWGLVGFCPGPALVALGADGIKALVFFASMLAGMLVFDTLGRLGKPVPADPAQQPVLSAAADG